MTETEKLHVACVAHQRAHKLALGTLGLRKGGQKGGIRKVGLHLQFFRKAGKQGSSKIWQNHCGQEYWPAPAVTEGGGGKMEWLKRTRET